MCLNSSCVTMAITSTWQFHLEVREVETMSLGRCESAAYHIHIGVGKLSVIILRILCSTLESRNGR